MATDLDIQRPVVVEIVIRNPHQFPLTSVMICLIIYERSLFQQQSFAVRFAFKFGSGPDIIGKTLLLDGAAFQVVGVIASGVRFPGEVDAWVPLALNAPQERQREEITLVRAIGRLKPGVTMEQTQADLEVVTRRIAQSRPDMHIGAQVRISKLSEQMIKSFLQLRQAEKGFQAENALTMTIPLSLSKYPPESPQLLAF